MAGASGLVGSAIVRRLRTLGVQNILRPRRRELNLLDSQAVDAYLSVNKPDWVFVAAAKVGGIYANNTYPAEFIYDNLLIQTNLIHGSYRAGVEKLLFLGSSCIYPKHAPQPIKEEFLLTGLLEPTNEPYAIAKIAGIKMCQSYNRQYGTNFVSVMPTNLYGIGDNYDPLNSHVLPALIRRFHEARQKNASEVVIWGTGKPYREFMFADDMADACIHVMENFDGSEIINIGSGQEVTIAELAGIIAQVVGFEGKIGFDTSKPDGTPRKLLDVTRLQALGWDNLTPLEEGIAVAYRDYLETGGRVHEYESDPNLKSASGR